MLCLHLCSLFGGYLYANNDACSEQVFSLGQHQVALALYIQAPAFAEGEVVLVTEMDAAKETVGITTGTGSDT